MGSIISLASEASLGNNTRALARESPALIAAMAEKCLIHSIAAEQEFMDRLRIDSNAEFTDFLAAHFDKAGLISLKNGL
jgi:hypothetical protein